MDYAGSGFRQYFYIQFKKSAGMEERKHILHRRSGKE